MLPHEFTLEQLRTVCEAVGGAPLSDGDLERRPGPLLRRTGRTARAGTGPPAVLCTVGEEPGCPPTS